MVHALTTIAHAAPVRRRVGGRGDVGDGAHRDHLVRVRARARVRVRARARVRVRVRVRARVRVRVR